MNRRTIEAVTIYVLCLAPLGVNDLAQQGYPPMGIAWRALIGVSFVWLALIVLANIAMLRKR